ncbi:hypothetical protein HPB51_022737 [Rhipicephalus microplus]|uniref:DIX domain-containing protein n=1 Tax=Rhipicephalus microplus TaxID=6941 RepID=A0A9J6EJ48_RHIMP|nr:hypothetical protein HPB51_022737 [Rhipicephalus microplus]
MMRVRLSHRGTGRTESSQEEVAAMFGDSDRETGGVEALAVEVAEESPVLRPLRVSIEVRESSTSTNIVSVGKSHNAGIIIITFTSIITQTLCQSSVADWRMLDSKAVYEDEKLCEDGEFADTERYDEEQPPHAKRPMMPPGGEQDHSELVQRTEQLRPDVEREHEELFWRIEGLVGGAGRQAVQGGEIITPHRFRSFISKKGNHRFFWRSCQEFGTDVVSEEMPDDNEVLSLGGQDPCHEQLLHDVEQDPGELNRLIDQLSPDLLRSHGDLLRFIEQLPPDVEQVQGSLIRHIQQLPCKVVRDDGDNHSELNRLIQKLPAEMVCDYSELIRCVEHQLLDVEQNHAALDVEQYHSELYRLLHQLPPNVVRDHSDLLRLIEHLLPDMLRDHGD